MGFTYNLTMYFYLLSTRPLPKLYVLIGFSVPWLSPAMMPAPSPKVLYLLSPCPGRRDLQRNEFGSTASGLGKAFGEAVGAFG